MKVLVRFFIATLVFYTVSACSTPQRRAHERAAAFHAMPAQEQKMVFHRRVSSGMSKDAVYIAWGKPDFKITGDQGKIVRETWLYQRHLTITEPFGANDQYGPDHGWGRQPFTMRTEPGFGFRGFGDDGLFRYQPHVRVIDAECKRAEFMDGKLVNFADPRGGFSGLPPP